MNMEPIDIAFDQLPSNPEPNTLKFDTPNSIFSFLLEGPAKTMVLEEVHTLRIAFPNATYDPSNIQHESCLVAIGILLRLLPGLEDLILLWNNVSPRVFDNVEFQLRALTTTMGMDEFDAVKFLTMQRSLNTVELPCWKTYTSRPLQAEEQGVLGHGIPLLPPDAFLPALDHVSLPPSGIMQLVPGRPLKSVDVRLSGVRHASHFPAFDFASFNSNLPLDILPQSPISGPKDDAYSHLHIPFGMVPDENDPLAWAMIDLTSESEAADDDSDLDTLVDRRDSISDLADTLPIFTTCSSSHIPSIATFTDPYLPVARNLNEPLVQLEPHDWLPLLQAVQASSDIVDDFAIATVDEFDVDVALRAIASTLPGLRALYVRIYAPPDLPVDYVRWAHWTPYLAQLPHLEMLRIEFDCRHILSAPPYRALTSSLAPPYLRHLINSVWNTEECCPVLGNMSVGIWGGDALIDWHGGEAESEFDGMSDL
ncbi:hypothetical protein DL93DRAFT_2082025 [Clavulina sp. PMI_390]|nr:hypothetical protein DL93DRAFT_2082025 [Clavulina sp. PMI_390]